MTLEEIHEIEDRLTAIYMKEVDDTDTTVEEDDDNYQVSPRLYNELIQKYQIFPKLDTCADSVNRMCIDYITKEQNALVTEWLVNGKPVSFWSNPPGSLQLKFIARAEIQVQRYDMNGMMILPSRVLGTHVWHKYIEGRREYHAIQGRPCFLKNGKPTKWAAMHAYVVVIWRKI